MLWVYFVVFFLFFNMSTKSHSCAEKNRQHSMALDSMVRFYHHQMEVKLISMLVLLLAGTFGVWLVNTQSGKSLKRNNSICCNSRGNLLLITSLYREWSHQSHRCCAARISVSISWLFGSADINVVSQHCKIAQGLLFCPSSLPKWLQHNDVLMFEQSCFEKTTHYSNRSREPCQGLIYYWRFREKFDKKRFMERNERSMREKKRGKKLLRGGRRVGIGIGVSVTGH